MLMTEIAGVKFDVLTAGDVFDGNVAGGDAGVEFGVSWDANFEIDVIARATADVKLGVATGAGEGDSGGRRFWSLSFGDVHRELSVFGADNADIA